MQGASLTSWGWDTSISIESLFILVFENILLISRSQYYTNWKSSSGNLVQDKFILIEYNIIGILGIVFKWDKG